MSKSKKDFWDKFNFRKYCINLYLLTAITLSIVFWIVISGTGIQVTELYQDFDIRSELTTFSEFSNHLARYLTIYVLINSGLVVAGFNLIINNIKESYGAKRNKVYTLAITFLSLILAIGLISTILTLFLYLPIFNLGQII